MPLRTLDQILECEKGGVEPTENNRGECHGSGVDRARVRGVRDSSQGFLMLQPCDAWLRADPIVSAHQGAIEPFNLSAKLAMIHNDWLPS